MKYIINYENKIKKVLNEKVYKYYIDTMGCALNENDSMKYSGILSKMGFEKAENIEDANIVLFNTCSIRENAEKTLYGRLGALKNRKKTDENFYICVVGCMSQQKHILEKIKESYSYVDIVLGTHSMQYFAKSFYNVISLNKKVVEYVEDKDELTEEIPIIYEEGVKASVSIIYGCNNFCTYCIVPYVRGREKSRKTEDILNDIKYLAKQGYKEITLLGQNVNSYGNDFKDNSYNFVNLLKDVEDIEGIDSIKFISPHPKDFSDELIKYIATSKKVSKQIHLPLQSGSSKILKLMGRKYTKEKYLNLVDKMKKIIPNVSFSTDVIVGFPNETELDFLDTLDVVEKVEYNQVYMFIYSPRKGTVAEKMEGHISEEIQKERFQRLKKLADEIIYKKNDEYVGKIYNILIEGKSKNNEDKYTGRTADGKIVIIDAKPEDIGKEKEIKIVSNNKWYLTGEII